MCIVVWDQLVKRNTSVKFVGRMWDIGLMARGIPNIKEIGNIKMGYRPQHSSFEQASAF